MICDRCKQETFATIMSFFNTETICLECADKEKAHPKYAEAVAAEQAEVDKGNRHFPGIGKPEDL